MTQRLHADELPIDIALVQALVAQSFPAYADLPVRSANASGSSNALFRLGDELLVRVPRQPGGGRSIEKEERWLPRVAAYLDARVPEVVGVGEPGAGYPERWSITRWLDGTRATTGGGEGLAEDLAELVRSLRAMPVPDEVDDELTWYRGGPLTDLDEDFRASLGACRGLGLDLDLDVVLQEWDRAVEAAATRPPERTWLHGDLLAENLLLDGRGRLSALLDLGGLAVGDPTVDLVVAWEVLGASGRAAFRRALDVDDATWAVGRGWALLIAVITFPYYGVTMPQRCADRLAMARAVLEER